MSTLSHDVKQFLTAANRQGSYSQESKQMKFPEAQKAEKRQKVSEVLVQVVLRTLSSEEGGRIFWSRTEITASN